MTLAALVPLLAAVVSLGLGLVVNRQLPGARLARVFSFVSFTLILWNLHFFVIYYVVEKDTALLWASRLRFAVFFLHPAVLHLIALVQEEERRVSPWIIWGNYGVGLLLAFADFRGLIVADLHRFSWGFYSVGGPWYRYFSLYVFWNAGAAIVLLTRAYRRCRSPIRRLQIRFWLIGVYIALPLGVTNLLPAYGISFYPLGNLGNVVWAGIMAYAIVRYRLLDIDLVIARWVAYVGGFAAVMMPAGVAIVFLQEAVFGAVNAEFSFGLVAILVTVGVGFNWVRSLLEARIGRSLFPAKLESRSALTTFARSIGRIFDRDRILQELAVTLGTALNIESILVLSRDPATGRLVPEFGVGSPSPAVSEEFLLELTRLLEPGAGARLAEELARESPIIAATLAMDRWVAALPMTVHDQLVGVILLGRKLGLSPLYSEDLALLETLACEAAVAIENARLYEALRASQDIIQRAERSSALGVLAAGIAHEIRNPLVSIQTFFQLAPDRLNDPEFMTTFLDTAAGEARRISKLINELLSFARSPQPSFRETDLCQLIDSVVTLLGPEARRSKVYLSQGVSPSSLAVHGNPEQLRQVLVNVVFNAIQATEPGGSVCVSARAVRYRDAAYGQLEVRDTGAGIAPDKLNSIFDPFFTTKESGTGLGLAIVQQIIAEHRGRIRVHSKPGDGATFLIDIPCPAGSIHSHGTGSVSLAESMVGEGGRPSDFGG